MQEQNGSLAEKLSQAEARLAEAQEISSSRAQNLAVELEQAKSRSNQVQVSCSNFLETASLCDMFQLHGTHQQGSCAASSLQKDDIHLPIGQFQVSYFSFNVSASRQHIERLRMSF